jgi:N-acetylglucosamine-6-sulfatase
VTDLVANKSVEFLDDAAASKKPFFLTVAPISCHAETVVSATVAGATVQLDGTHPLINSALLATAALTPCDAALGGAANSTFSNPVPAARHQDLFADVSVPRTENFNPDEV